MQPFMIFANRILSHPDKIMATIKIIERASSVAGRPATIYIRIIHNREVKMISTGMNRQFDADLIDRYIAPYKRAIDNLDRKGEPYILEDVLARAAAPHDAKDILTYIGERVGQLVNDGKTGTARKYMSLRNNMAEFLGDSRWWLEDTDRLKIQSFNKFLMAKGITRNTASSYMRPLAAILRLANAQGLIEFDPHWFEGVYMGIDKTAKRALSVEDMIKIHAFDVEGSSPLQLAKDIFLFSFYTMGMPFVDIAHLTKENLHGAEIVYRRQKTGQTIHVPLNKHSSELIARYASPDSEYIFPLLKESGFKYDTALRNHNKRLKLIAERAKCSCKITSYMSRHTWATFARDSGVEISVISAGMGHTSEKTTRIYLASINIDTLRAANDKVAGLIGKRTKWK